MKIDYQEYKIEGPPSIFYVPDFITQEEETSLLDNIAKAPIPKWTQLSNRRLQNWGGLPHPRGMIAEEIPPWLKKHVDNVSALELFNGKIPNHVLVNEYLPGQGIMPHLDGSLFHPTITTINLGSHTVLNFYEPLNINSTHTDTKATDFKNRLRFSLLLKPRSLLILQDECYTNYLHGIEDISKDIISSSIINSQPTGVSLGEEMSRGTRVSLTIRFVPKSTKPLLRLGK